MDLKKSSEMWTKLTFSAAKELPEKVTTNQQQPFPHFNSQQKWEIDPSLLDYGMSFGKQFSGPNQPSETNLLPLAACNTSNNQIKIPSSEHDSRQINEVRDKGKIQGWDPRVMLSSLSFMEQKIHQLQDLVHLIVGRRSESMDDRANELEAQQQQLITADLTSIIVQLISTAGTLLPSVKHAHNHSSANPSTGGIMFPSGVDPNGSIIPPDTSNNNNNVTVNKVEDQSNETDHFATEQMYAVEEHEEEDGDEGENLPPGSYEILQLEKEEILAPHTHFCLICGKGFKRDANLRMHMRGHGDEYKTPAALAKPHKESSSSEARLIKRYSCPYVGCKRNKDHKKFQPLKTILCVKNHYKRTHCDKSYICSRCNTKKFSVIADLKTHEKHCGRDKWLCSCGTTFSRKDKLFGHIALFQGHTPAIPLDEAPNKVARIDFNYCPNNTSATGTASGVRQMECVEDVKGGIAVEPSAYFSPLNFDNCSLSGMQDFPRPLFEDSESSFSFLLSDSSNYPWKNGGESGSNNPQ